MIGTEILMALFVVNLIAFIIFGYDKVLSKGNRGRISEVKLLTVALIGPFGAYMGMRTFRHKTRKLKFLLVPLFMILQLALLAYLSFGIAWPL